MNAPWGRGQMSWDLSSSAPAVSHASTRAALQRSCCRLLPWDGDAFLLCSVLEKDPNAADSCDSCSLSPQG